MALCRTFIMLAGPGMIGKSTAARNLSQLLPSSAVLENDRMMHQIFDLVRLPEPNMIPINQVDSWRHRVSDRADCNRLIRLHHRDWVARHQQSPVIIAEGYTYMLRWYREQVRVGLDRLGYDFDYWLLKYGPPMSEQVIRRAKKCQSWGLEEQTPLFHQHELEEQWSAFESLSSMEAVKFKKVDDQDISEIKDSITVG